MPPATLRASSAVGTSAKSTSVCSRTSSTIERRAYGPPKSNSCPPKVALLSLLTARHAASSSSSVSVIMSP